MGLELLNRLRDELSDISQVDLRKDQSSGLIDAKEKLKEINGIGFTLLDSSDVLRHRLVKKILDKYKKWIIT